MVKQNSSSRKKRGYGQSSPTNGSSEPNIDIEEKFKHFIEEEFNRLQATIYDSFHIPLTSMTIVNEEVLIRQLEQLEGELPSEFRQALDIIARKDLIISEAEDYAQKILESAKKRANQMLNETGIIQQAEMEARQLKQKVQQECEALQRRTLAEVEKMRISAQDELEHLRQMTIQESDNIHKDADEYADAVLNHLEQNLNEMLRVVQNGRRRLYSSDNSPR